MKPQSLKGFDELRKPKMARVKAWAYMVEGEYTGAAKYKTHPTDIPCTILIEARHLKGTK